MIEVISSDKELILRQFDPDDSAEIFDLIDNSRQHLSEYGDDTAAKYPTLEAVLKSITHPVNPGRLRFGIWTIEGTLVGSINLTPDPNRYLTAEIGYYLGEQFTGRGYMLRAVKALTAFALDDLGYETVYGKVAQDNTPSIKVLQKAGYHQTKRKNGEIYFARKIGKLHSGSASSP